MSQSRSFKSPTRCCTRCLPTLYFPTLYRYVFWEITTPFFLVLFVFTGILFLLRSLKLVDMVINKNVPLTDIILLFSYIIPAFLELAIPMALLIGVMLAFGRLSADSELVVIRATGTSISQLVKPVFAFALLALGACTMMSLYFRPWADYRLGIGIFEIAKLKATSGLIPGVFNDLNNLTIYAATIDQDTGRLSNVIIADRRDDANPRTFLAQYGDLIANQAERTLSLRLYDGMIHEGRGLNFHLTNFQINSIGLNQDELFSDTSTKDGKKTKEMFISELNEYREILKHTPMPHPIEFTRSIAKCEVEYHRRFAIPVSCLCVALMAMALGVQPSRGGHHWGASANIIVGIACISVYYMLFALGEGLGSNGQIPAWLGMWGPNLIFGSLAIIIFLQIGSERWMAVSEAIADRFAQISHSLSTLFRNS